MIKSKRLQEQEKALLKSSPRHGFCLICHQPHIGIFFLTPGARQNCELCARCRDLTDAQAERPSGAVTIPNRWEIQETMAFLKGQVSIVLASHLIGVKESVIDNFWEERTVHAQAYWRRNQVPPQRRLQRPEWSMMPPSSPGWYFFAGPDQKVDSAEPTKIFRDEAGALRFSSNGNPLFTLQGLWWPVVLTPPSLL